MKKEGRIDKCEAFWGKNACDKKFTTTVFSGCVVYNLCKGCAKVIKKQIKLNNS
jgi:hypothetical protein